MSYDYTLKKEDELHHAHNIELSRAYAKLGKNFEINAVQVKYKNTYPTRQKFCMV